MMDLPIIHNLPQLIHDLIPNHYTALDLGSGDGSDSKLIQQNCSKAGKEGTFVRVDPFIVQQDIIKKTMEDYVGDCDLQFDLILIKCAFHFNKDHPNFFKHCHRLLKKEGKMVIIQMGNECELPWTKALQQNFLSLLLLAEHYIPQELFTFQKIVDIKKCLLNRGLFREFVKSRGWSNLLTHSQQEIDDCLALIDSQ